MSPVSRKMTEIAPRDDTSLLEYSSVVISSGSSVTASDMSTYSCSGVTASDTSCMTWTTNCDGSV